MRTGFIRTLFGTFAVLTLIGIIGAIYWLVYAKKPVVDLHCMKDRNFATSSLLMAGMAMILYGSSVVIPQLAQQDLGYTGHLVRAVLSPGAVLIVLTIPLVLKLMPVVQTRWIIAFGFTCLAVSFFWSRTLTPDIDFETLVLFRQRPVDRAWVPVCSSHHHCFYFDTEAAERRCGGAVHHVPQRGGLNWHLAFYGGHYRTFPGAQRASGLSRVTV